MRKHPNLIPKGRLPRSPFSDAFSPVILMLMFSFLGFIGVMIFLTYASSQGATIMSILGVNLQEISRAFLIFLIYLAFWMVGYFSSQRIATRRTSIFVPSGVRASRGIGAVVLIALIIALWGAYAFHPEKDAQFRSSLTSGAYGLLFFVILTATIAFFGIFSSRLANDFGYRFFKTRGSTMIFLVWAVGFLLLSLVLFSMGGRGRLITIVIIIAAIWHYSVRPISVLRLQLLAVSAIALVQAMPILLGTVQATNSSVFTALWGIENGRTFDGLYNLTVIANFWWKQGIWGLPGELWLGDIVGDLGLSGFTNTRDAVMLNVYGMSTYSAGFPATKPGELLLNFGLAGVPIGGFLLGFAAERLYRLCVLRRVFGVASVPIYITVLFRLGLASPLGYFAQNIVLSMVAFIISVLIWIVFFGAYSLRRMPDRDQRLAT